MEVEPRTSQVASWLSRGLRDARAPGLRAPGYRRPLWLFGGRLEVAASQSAAPPAPDAPAKAPVQSLANMTQKEDGAANGNRLIQRHLRQKIILSPYAPSKTHGFVSLALHRADFTALK